jgi:uncharacterized phiE125 gp8 family phage protein
MSSILLAGPAVEPITLTQAKQFLRVEHDDDDDVITILIAASRRHVETQTRRALITQRWRLMRDEWPASGCLELLPAPVQTLEAVRVYKRDGTTLAIDLASFTLDKSDAPARLCFRYGMIVIAPPSPERYVNGIEIDVTCGYGDDPEDVPEPLRHALRMLLTHWYDNRGIIGENQFVPLPQSAAALIAPYRVLSL